MLFGGVAQSIEHDSGLHASEAARGINLEDLRHVLRKIKDNGDVAALTGERCAAAAAEQWGAEFTADRDGGENVMLVAGQNDADRHLAVVGAVGGVERAAAVVEADLAANLPPQGACQLSGTACAGRSRHSVCHSAAHGVAFVNSTWTPRRHSCLRW